MPGRLRDLQLAVRGAGAFLAYAALDGCAGRVPRIAWLYVVCGPAASVTAPVLMLARVMLPDRIRRHLSRHAPARSAAAGRRV